VLKSPFLLDPLACRPCDDVTARFEQQRDAVGKTEDVDALHRNSFAGLSRPLTVLAMLAHKNTHAEKGMHRYSTETKDRMPQQYTYKI
jgi:hypothetical protein